MNILENARLTPRGRGILVSRLHRGEHPADVATSMGISPRTVYQWPPAGDYGFDTRAELPTPGVLSFSNTVIYPERAK